MVVPLVISEAKAVVCPKLAPKFTVPLPVAAIKVKAWLPSTLPLKLISPPWFCVTAIDPLVPALSCTVPEPTPAVVVPPPAPPLPPVL